MHLKVSDIHVRYDGDVDVLNGVSIDVAPGQLVGVIGPNGAGKSTLLKSIARFVGLNAGSIVLDGKDMRGIGPHDLAKLGVGYLMEGHSVFPGMSVEENLMLGAWSMRRNSAGVRAAVESAFARAPILKEKRQINAGLLSGGQQRILEIERLYMTRPRLIILDEPSIGLSPKLAEVMLQQIVGFRDQGAAVLLVDQNARRIAQVADYVYVMQLGAIQIQGSGRELLSNIEKIVSEFI